MFSTLMSPQSACFCIDALITAPVKRKSLIQFHETMVLVRAMKIFTIAFYLRTTDGVCITDTDYL